MCLRSFRRVEQMMVLNGLFQSQKVQRGVEAGVERRATHMIFIQETSVEHQQSFPEVNRVGFCALT